MSISSLRGNIGRDASDLINDHKSEVFHSTFLYGPIDMILDFAPRLSINTCKVLLDLKKITWPT